MRRFTLQNSIGERRGLNDVQLLLTEPAGFGYERNNEYADLGNGFFKKTKDDSDKQLTMTGKIIFTDKPYETYREYINWINQSYDLELVYVPYGATEFFREIDITSIGKSELAQVGWLEVPITVQPKTPWYKIRPRTQTIEPSTDGYTVFTFPMGARFAKTNMPFTDEVGSEGHTPSGIVIDIAGPVSNPIITLKDMVTDEEYGKCIINASAVDGERITYYSLKRKTVVIKTDSNGVQADLLENLAIAPNMFFSIPLNRACSVSIEGGTTAGATATRSIYDYYRSV